MTSSEAKRSFSTLKRIKTCLRRIIGDKRLNALFMLSIESENIGEYNDFNKKVIDLFLLTKNRRIDFVYKILT